MIHAIELENTELCHSVYGEDGADFVAFHLLCKLERLAPRSADELGEDLNAAIERWRAASEVHRSRRETNERKRLLDVARRGIDSESPGRKSAH